VDSLLKGDAPALAKTCPRLASIELLGAGVLLIDERDGDVEILRSMIPSSLYFDGCKSANEGLSHAHDHKFDLALFNADNAITNLTGTLAQLHLLLPDGFIVGVASVPRDEDPQRALKALSTYDFDDLTVKPFKGDTVEKLIGRYCSSWDDLVVVTDDLIKASPRRSRKEDYKAFACNLRTRLEEGLRSLSDACFEHAVVDISDADSVTTMDTAEILRRLSSQAKPLGISARFVAAPTTIAAIRKCEASFGWPAISLFPSVTAARAAKA
jgi:response regulator RpfG family c-di-GMP phosphodiesterase